MLQTKAVQKFGVFANGSHNKEGQGTQGDVDYWWAIDPSLQQSTAWQVAQLKASWFADQDVMDLCCGLGGDSLRIAQHAQRLVALDLDPVVAAIARANLSRTPSHGCRTDGHGCGGGWEVQHADATEVEIPQNVWLHLDPDRRASGQRTTHQDHFQPAWDQVLQWAKSSPATVVKLAPATKLDSSDALSGLLGKPVHRCWISLSGSVREQTLLVGQVGDQLAPEGSDRSAIVIRADGQTTMFHGSSTERETAESTSSVDRVGEWLIDPDAAIRAAGLTESFCNRFSLSCLGSPAGFQTTEESQVDPELKSQSVAKPVLWSGPADDRKLRKTLREHNWSVQTIKCRGTDHQPEKLVRQYQRLGDDPVILWIGRAGKRVFAAITLP